MKVEIFMQISHFSTELSSANNVAGTSVAPIGINETMASRRVARVVPSIFLKTKNTQLKPDKYFLKAHSFSVPQLECLLDDFLDPFIQYLFDPTLSEV